jgi:CDP-paratose 2-epimerase
VRVLVTGGAGFIGGNLAISLRSGHADWEVRALDNLRRRGGELNLPRLRAAGVEFIHGDVRVLDDLLSVGDIDALVECSAEPSVLAG